jgi:hypothetical protein
MFSNINVIPTKGTKGIRCTSFDEILSKKFYTSKKTIVKNNFLYQSIGI